LNENLLKFKELTYCNKDNTSNFLEGTNYYENSKSFIDLCIYLDNNNIKYKIVSGFKGKTNFGKKENQFKNIILEFDKKEQTDVVKSIINSNYKEVLQYKSKDNKIKIELKDT